MKPTFKSIGLVALQLAAIAYLLCTGPWYVRVNRPLWLAMELAGLLLIVWAVAVMKPGNLRATPEVPAHARLVTSGPYRFIRHPMYAAVLLALGALVGNRPTVPRLIVFVILVVVLVIKLHYEEGLLRQRFAEYRDYQRRTKRLVPFVY